MEFALARSSSDVVVVVKKMSSMYLFHILIPEQAARMFRSMASM
jgi:hypothetical protein